MNHAFASGLIALVTADVVPARLELTLSIAARWLPLARLHRENVGRCTSSKAFMACASSRGVDMMAEIRLPFLSAEPKEVSSYISPTTHT